MTMGDDTRPGPGGADGQEEDVRALLHLAGRRPRLPEPEVAPVRAAARAAWRRQVRATAARRRRAWSAAAAAAGLLVVAGLAVLRQQAASPAAPVATLEVEMGAVEVGGPAASGAAAGQLLPGTVIRTGERGRAAVRLAGGPSLRIDGGSQVRLDAPRGVTLEAGAVYVDSRRDAGAAGPIEIATRLGAVREVGTQFEVRLLAPGEPGAALRVRVREGAVLVRAGAAVHEARAGGELLLSADGTTRRAAMPGHGPDWAWVEQTAPPLELDGASLATFLAWAGRETGLRWRFVGPHPHAAPEDVVLHGSIEGLTPEEALAVVLPGAGLRHRRVGGELWLEASEAGEAGF
jgi:hypothetical protein